jgi:hypothetical protein
MKEGCRSGHLSTRDYIKETVREGTRKIKIFERYAKCPLNRHLSP